MKFKTQLKGMGNTDWSLHLINYTLIVIHLSLWIFYVLFILDLLSDTLFISSFCFFFRFYITNEFHFNNIRFQSDTFYKKLKKIGKNIKYADFLCSKSWYYWKRQSTIYLAWSIKSINAFCCADLEKCNNISWLKGNSIKLCSFKS